MVQKTHHDGEPEVHQDCERVTEAIDAYIGSIKETYCTDAGDLTESGRTKIQGINFSKEYVADLRLADLDMNCIGDVYQQIAQRPVSKKTGKPISVTTARLASREFRRFLRWLHTSHRFSRRLPPYYDTRADESTLYRQLFQRRVSHPSRYTIEQLTTLWKYATPFERCLLTLGLNCGFGAAEIGTLRREEVRLHQPHPQADRMAFSGTAKDSWIRRVRQKTSAYGEWKLWRITVAALEWITANRPQSDSPYLLLTTKGKPLWDNGHQSSLIFHVWKRLNERVGGSINGFDMLPFSTLRRTAANEIGDRSDHDTVSLFLGHRLTAKGWNMAPRFAELHRTLDELEKHYLPVFSAVDEPFHKQEQ